MHESWRRALSETMASQDIQNLQGFLAARQAAGATILPPCDQRFAAFELTPLPEVKVVILGQDPYHGPGQAHGLAFSVCPGVAIPPSLKNVFREIEADLGLPVPTHGHLVHWAKQGVLLLNDVLTVEPGHPGAHQRRGWETLTEAAIRAVNDGPHPVVFMLWGRPAQKKAGFVDTGRHLVLQSSHPSPLGAYRGFLGCRHFSQANDWLRAHGRGAVDWSLPPA